MTSRMLWGWPLGPITRRIALTGVKLREILEREHSIGAASTRNRYPIGPQKIRARIAECAAG
jgi:hypothetical protein